MKVKWIQHKIDFKDKPIDFECDQCENEGRYEVMYEEEGGFKSRIAYLCGDCESDIEEVQ